jgi:hypothetical protein
VGSKAGTRGGGVGAIAMSRVRVPALAAEGLSRASFESWSIGGPPVKYRLKANPAKRTKVSTIMVTPRAPLRDQLTLRAAVTLGMPGSPRKGVMVLPSLLSVPSAGSSADGFCGWD